MKLADAETFEITQQILSLEYQLAQHREMLRHYQESGNRIKSVQARLLVLEIEMMLASLRRKVGQ